MAHKIPTAIKENVFRKRNTNDS